MQQLLIKFSNDLKKASKGSASREKHLEDKNSDDEFRRDSEQKHIQGRMMVIGDNDIRKGEREGVKRGNDSTTTGLIYIQSTKKIADDSKSECTLERRDD